jgi:hypothetical protein
MRSTKRLKNIPTASGGITRAAYAFAVRARVPVGALLKRANLTLQQAKNAQMRIAVRDQIEFLNLVADELDDEFLGIKLAQTILGITSAASKISGLAIPPKADRLLAHPRCAKKRNQVIFDCRRMPETARSDIFLITP